MTPTHVPLSYRFGPDDAGGIVIFSGFLDDILPRNAQSTERPTNGRVSRAVQQSVTPTSFWFKRSHGLFFPALPPPPLHHPTIRWHEHDATEIQEVWDKVVGQAIANLEEVGYEGSSVKVIGAPPRVDRKSVV